VWGMKIIYVYSEDDDYNAMTFADKFPEPSLKMWEDAKQDDKIYDKKSGQEVLAQALEFKDVDPEFIKFMRDEFIDYDQSKQCDFFVVEE
jgi:hypothetical protein